MERSDADFYHIFMPHDTDGKNRCKAKNNGKFHLFSSGWKNGENHLFPSRWKFGAVWAEKRRRYRGDTAAARSAPGLCRFMQGNEKPESVAHGKQIRISRFWYARRDSNSAIGILMVIILAKTGSVYLKQKTFFVVSCLIVLYVFFLLRETKRENLLPVILIKI